QSQKILFGGLIMNIFRWHIWMFLVFLGVTSASDSVESLQANTKKEQSKHEIEIKHRYFVGASLGYGMSSITSSGVTLFTDSGNGLNYGFYIGQETQMPESDFSARYYTSLDYILVNYPGQWDISTFKIGFNFDVLYNIKHYLDVFGGLGVGFNFFGGNTINNYRDVYINHKIGYKPMGKSRNKEIIC
ncbi:porin family protein, partial [Helicobacter cinaedi]